MKTSAGSFSWSVRRWCWMHHFRRSLRIQAGLHQRKLTDTAEGNDRTSQSYFNAIAKKKFTGCADAKCTSTAIMTAPVRRPISSYTGIDTFTSCSRTYEPTKKLHGIRTVTSDVKGSSTTTPLINPLSGPTHLHSLTAVTDVPRRSTGCAHDAFTGSESAIFRCTRGRCFRVNTLVGSNISISNPAAENSVDNCDGNFFSNGHCPSEPYPTSRLPGFNNLGSADNTSQSRNELHWERDTLVPNTPLYALSNASKGFLRGPAMNGICKKFVSPSTAYYSCSMVEASRIRPFCATNNSVVFKDNLKKEISTGRYNWLVGSRIEKFIALPFMSCASRSFFLAKINKTGGDSATWSSDPAAAARRQASANAETFVATKAHEASKRFTALNNKREGEEIEKTTESANSGSTSNSQSVCPSSTTLRSLPGGASVRNDEVSQLKVFEAERKIVAQRKTSTFPLFLSFSTKDQKNNVDALPGAGPTAPVKEKGVLKSAKIPLSKKLGSFIFGFFLASGCCFFIMYCQVADATLILQQIAKDATHRLAILESRVLELEKRCHC